MNFDLIYTTLCTWAEAHGISVREEPLAAKKAGEFDGLSATMNSDYASEERAYYLVHALGSIVRWSLDFANVHHMFQQLRAAKKSRGENPARLTTAIDRYRAFEIESSEYAVWLLGKLGHGDAIPSYTNFMRADLETLTQFHLIGEAPVWRDFFARWKEEVRSGHRTVKPYIPNSIPEFQPSLIENQEILQRQPFQKEYS